MTEIKKLKIAGAIIYSIGLIITLQNQLIGYILMGVGIIISSLEILKIIK